jgi:hypothetical protein
MGILKDIFTDIFGGNFSIWNLIVLHGIEFQISS